MTIKVDREYDYSYVPETKEDLDWAERELIALFPGSLALSLPVVTLDLSKYETEQGQQELAKELLEAVNEKGFFYLKNFGLPAETVDRQFGIGHRFYSVPVEERMKSVSDLKNGNSNGYAPAGKRDFGGGLKGKSRW